jgi:hypothetical protein
MSVSYITHNNKKVLFIEYKECKTVEDTLHVLDEIKEEFFKTSGVWLTLHDMSVGYGSNEFMKRANQYAKNYYNSRPAKNAAIGATGLKKILLQGYNLIVKDKIVPFDTMEEALEYLTK